MKKAIITMTLWAISVNSIADEISNTINELNKKKAEIISEKILEAKGIKKKGDSTINREIDIKKPLSECIKPDNVIDDEVKKCMEGTLEKNW